MNGRLRRATEADLPAMLGIYAPYVESTPWSFEYAPPSLEEFSERYIRITKEYFWICCEVNGEIAGYAYASRPFARAAYGWNAEISVYIQPAYHRKGIGTALQKSILDLLTLQGCQNVYSVIVAGNEGSVKTAERLGMTRFATFKNAGYKLGGWHDVLWYEKALSLPAAAPRAFLAPKGLEAGAVDRILKNNGEGIRL